jgi:hypothetical protein
VTYYKTEMGFIANIPRELSKWAALLRPYQLTVWLSLLVALIFAGPVVWWIGQKSAKRIEAMTLQMTYEMTLKIFVLQGITIFLTFCSLK